MTDETLEILKSKHPKSAEVKEGALLNGPLEQVTESFYSFLDEKSILDASLRTKGTAGHSGMVADI